MANKISVKTVQKKSISVSSLGSGDTFLVSVSGNREIIAKTIDGADTIITYTSSNGTIILSSFAIHNVSSLGGGASVVSKISTSRELLLKSIVSSVNINPYVSGNDINFRITNINQVSAITSDISEPLLYTLATAKSSSNLSVEPQILIFARAGAFLSNSVLFCNGITSNAARISFPYNCRIFRVFGSITACDNSPKSLSIFVDNTEFTDILSFPVTSVRTYSYNTNVNILVSANQGISAIIRGGTGTVSNPIMCIFMKIILP